MPASEPPLACWPQRLYAQFDGLIVILSQPVKHTAGRLRERLAA